MFSFRKIWKYIWPEMRKYPRAGIILFIAYAIGVLFDSILKPYVYKEIIDTYTAGVRSPETLHHLFVLLGVICAFILTHNIAYRAGDYANSYFESKVMKDLYDSTFKRLLGHSYTFFTNNFSGSIIAKTKRFSKSFETFFDVVGFQIWFSLVTLTGILTILAFSAPLFALVFFIWTIVYICITLLFVRRKMMFDIRESEADSSVIGQLSDAIMNIANIKIFGSGAREHENFQKITAFEETKRRNAWYFGNLQNATQAALMAVLQISIIISSIYLWYHGRISIGTIVLSQMYIFGLFDILWNLGRSLTKALKALVDMQEIVDIFEQTPDILDPANPEPLCAVNGNIFFNKMSFAYKGGIDVFADFNLDIKPGERIGLVGHSGAGKSTITKLLLRFADVTGGSIAIDGQDIRSVTQDDLRSVISYVPQESVLFHRTIAENILYAKPAATHEEVVEVAKKAHAHEFISKLPQGYDTLVGERGVKLSGGERQRVAIARAMLKNAPILILDEATSSLDSVSEQYIQEAFNELMKGKTTIVIAHRLSTIQKMDRIVVLENGAIVEEGTHKKLLAKKGVYADLWAHQVGGFIE